jgi:hypothetical protein
MNSDAAKSDWIEALRLLGVNADADEQTVRSAYMAKVRQHPPDRDPEMFEKLRDAFEQLRNPRVRAARVLAGPNPDAPLTDLVEGLPAPRRFVGPDAWMDVLKEKRA